MGAYLIAASEAAPDVVLIASGSEVSLALEARGALSTQGIEASVVSMPSWELFDEQSVAYRASVLPSGVPRISIEAGVTMGWLKYVGEGGATIGWDRFGMSAPGNIALAEAGFTAEAVVAAVKDLLG
jgi:transketolase